MSSPVDRTVTIKENGIVSSRSPGLRSHQPSTGATAKSLFPARYDAGPSQRSLCTVLRLQGVSLELIRQRCIAEGLVPALVLAQYTVSMIDRHLKNCFYAAIPNPHPDPARPGEMFISQFVWRNVWYQGKHEPIFTADEWTQLQASFGLEPAYRKRKHEGLFAQGPLGLSCAECGCKITYRYYRCADGRRVHRGSGARQINVRENDILDQFLVAVDAIEITAPFAETIADALNETHREAMAAKAKSAEVYRAETDLIEAALADALTQAAAAQQWQTVETLSRELTARREARSGVVELASARKRRGSS